MNFLNAKDKKHIRFIRLGIRFLAISLILVIMILSIVDIFVLRKNIENEILSQANVLSFNIAPALMFNDNFTANTLLNGLSFSPNIMSGLIFNKDKLLFASYSKDHDSILKEIDIEDFLSESKVIRNKNFRLLVSVPINKDGSFLGWIFLDADLIRIRERIALFVVLNLFVIIFVMVSVYLFSIISRTNESLNESETRYRSMAETVPCAIYHCANDDKWTMHFIGPQIEKMCGYPSTDFIENSIRTYDSIIEPSFKEAINVTINQAIISGKKWTLEYQIIHKDGSLRWVYEEGIGIYDRNNNVEYLDGFILDNTGRKRTEAALATSEAKYRGIYEEASDAIFLLDQDIIIDCNPNALELLGGERSEIVGNSVGDFSPEYQAHDVNSEKLIEVYVRKALQGQRQLFEWTNARVDGSEIECDVSLNSIEINSATYLQAIVRDISDRKKIQSELDHTRKLLKNIVDSMPSMLIGVDINSKITLWNRTAEKITGIDSEHASGKNFNEIFPDMQQELSKIKESIKSRQTQQAQKRPRLTDDGTCFEDVTIYPLVSNGVEGAVIRIDDVTEHVRLEEVLIQSEKMLSVGGLAAGMAHEINNPLAGIIQTANVMSNRLGQKLDMPANIRAAEEAGTTIDNIRMFMEKRSIPRMIDTINESGARVADIVDNMLSFARKTESTVSTHSMNEIIDKTLELAATDYDLKKKYDFKIITLIKEYNSTLPEIPCERAKIQQVFLNLFRNAAQAMQSQPNNKPAIIIRTDIDYQKQMVVIEVEDNGPGMSESVRKRVFEPFYTTKPVGIGTGLGLSVSYFIVTENHNGEMTVDSAPGEGAKFSIRLPLG